ncbi:PHP domain-containing protein, partial [Angustibacter peucedani]
MTSPAPVPSSASSSSSSSTASVTDPFVHLHVASGYSLRHGASSPDALVARAVEHGMGALALTDRDGLYGAVKFVLACRRAGIAPLLGVDLATDPTGLVAGLPAWADPSVAARAAGSGRAPVRGGALVDPYRPRVTVLAAGTGSDGVGSGEGWAALCRLVSAAHLSSGHLGGERGTPVVDLATVARHARPDQPADQPADAPSRLVVLLGPASEVGRA